MIDTCTQTQRHKPSFSLVFEAMTTEAFCSFVGGPPRVIRPAKNVFWASGLSGGGSLMRQAENCLHLHGKLGYCIEMVAGYMSMDVGEAT